MWDAKEVRFVWDFGISGSSLAGSVAKMTLLVMPQYLSWRHILIQFETCSKQTSQWTSAA